MQEDRRDNSAFLQQVKDLIGPVKDDTDRILRLLHGNGDPNTGLVAQTALNTDFRKTSKKNWRAVLGAATVSLFAAIGSLILTLLKHNA